MGTHSGFTPSIRYTQSNSESHLSMGTAGSELVLLATAAVLDMYSLHKFIYSAAR
jgi:hypothetical protein